MIEKVAPVELVEERVMVVTPGVGGGVVSEGGGGEGAPQAPPTAQAVATFKASISAPTSLPSVPAFL